MTTAKGRIHCLQFLQVQVQGIFPRKSAPYRKEKELEGDNNGEPGSLAVLSTCILRRKRCRATSPAARVASLAYAVFSAAAAAAATAAARGAAGEQCGQHPFFRTSHPPNPSAVEPREREPGGAAALTWGSPRAPPAPWPRGERPHQDQPARTPRTVRFCSAAACPLALPRGDWPVFLPRLLASLRLETW